MGSSDGTEMAVQDTSESTFPEADVERESNPGHHKSLEVDPISSQVAAASLEIQEAAIEAEESERELQRNKALQTLKTTIFVSAAVVAVAGSIFAITKKLREK